jgi:ArsR family transcriptional regulator
MWWNELSTGLQSRAFPDTRNPLRIRILEALRSAGSLTVTELYQRVGAEPSNVSQHLAIMRSRGLLATKRRGTSIWYSAAEPAVFDLLDVARGIFERQLAARTRLLESEDENTTAPAPR